MNIQQLYRLYLQHPNIQTDSRKLQKDDLFFALKGPNFNGNDYAQKALASGAAYAIVDEVTVEDERIILVKDVLTTLQALAQYHRAQLAIPFIAITGSNGKTTTKELIHAVLSSHLKTYTTEGNLNNHIGIPLTILKVKQDAEIAVIEMGANHQKEIMGYCVYTQPTHGIITNCGKAHLEGFGGVEGVRKGKGELFDFLRLNNGVAFALDDYAYLHQMSIGVKKVLWYGTHNGMVIGEAEKDTQLLTVDISKGLANKQIKTQLVGSYNLPNVLCAVAVGKYFGVPDEKITSAIEHYQPTNSRSQLIKLGSNEIILDAYNANPSSMELAIKNFAAMQAEKKILIIGGMKEMGVESDLEHERLVLLIDNYHWHTVVLVGAEFEPFHKQYLWFANAEQAKNWYQSQGFEQASILIKGSRGIALEKILT